MHASQADCAAHSPGYHYIRKNRVFAVPAARAIQLHNRPHRKSVRPATAAAAAALDASKLLVLPSVPEEYFPAADLHTTCFGHSRNASQALFERFDRIWGLQINDDLARRGAGKYTLLIAYDPNRAPQQVLDRAAAAAAAGVTEAGSALQQQASSASSSSSNTLYQLPSSEQYAFPALGYWLSRMVDRRVWAQLDRSFDDLGIVGVAQVDSFGDIIPPRALSARRDGAVGWVKRQGIAYISNVAVAPACRRCGVAQRLMAEAEAVAASWGCSRAGLHCNPSNAPAMQLYGRLRYRKGGLEAPWMPYLQGRAPDRCLLMLKRLAQQQQQQVYLQQQQQQQRLDAAAAGVAAATGQPSSAAALQQLR